MELTINKRAIKYVRAVLIIGSLASFILAAIVSIIFLAAKIAGPPPIAVPQTTVFYANDNSVIGQSHTGQNRYWIDMEHISPYVKYATLAVEDQRFYDHHGFDVKRIAGALLADVRAMAKVQGASTITQQYARNLYLTHDKTWKRKVVEALYTVRLEVNYNKSQILEGYLNTIYYGHGAYGIEAASRLYFGKSAKNLTLAEASMLAGIPKGPGYFSPYINEARAKARQALILKEMEKQGFITKTQRDKAAQEKLFYHPLEQAKAPTIAPYFQNMVQSVLIKELGMDEQTVQRGGLRIYTTLDRNVQEIVEKQVQDIIPASSEIETAVVSMDPGTGEVKALVGGRDYKKSQFNRATQAYRQPGSSFKPFLYYAALKQGFTPVTRLKSEYTTFKMNDGVSTYKPSNYNNYYADEFITMEEALAVSDNIYAVKTHLFLGEKALVNTAKEFGISSKLEAIPALALGTSPVKPIEMTAAYGMFANGGKKAKPVFIRRVIDQDGNVLYDSHLEREQVLDKDIAYVTAQMMTGMFNPKLGSYTSVTGQTIMNKLTRTYAGKSGSTKTDSWMIGFTPQLVTGVWVGYDKGKIITNPSEQRYAKIIWANVMEESLKDEPKKKFTKPAGVVGLNIDPRNGKIATKDCPIWIKMYFVKGTEPTEYCMDHLHEPDSFNDMKIKAKQQEKWYKKYLPW
ncbi:transglycosylase domain-containing protein [Bacillus sp. 165]|uniref:transglycosylase domain-containing protein n=1 Tax=Bacillus sp. 165 TaxID=1529117 RepID=UPI001ADBB615|nr:transglycosylase domain-containing protein [Bacillus sp. 165]MBO9130120.1 penicillin-binding protein [Bacillus sp. 165]